MGMPEPWTGNAGSNDDIVRREPTAPLLVILFVQHMELQELCRPGMVRCVLGDPSSGRDGKHIGTGEGQPMDTSRGAEFGNISHEPNVAVGLVAAEVGTYIGRAKLHLDIRVQRGKAVEVWREPSAGKSGYAPDQ